MKHKQPQLEDFVADAYNSSPTPDPFETPIGLEVPPELVDPLMATGMVAEYFALCFDESVEDFLRSAYENHARYLEKIVQPPGGEA